VGGSGTTLLAAAVIAIVKETVPVLPFASVTWTVTAEEPAAVGVPEITPVVASIVKPVGKVPVLSVKLNGSAPLLTTRAKLYGVPTVPERPDTGVLTTGLSVILSVTEEVATTAPAVFVPVALYLI
jgi:hypothetical protein